MSRGMSHILQIVVLSTDTEAFLRGCSRLVASLLCTEKCFFELYHAGIYKEECRVIGWDEAGAGDNLMTFGLEVRQKAASNFTGFHIDSILEREEPFIILLGIGGEKRTAQTLNVWTVLNLHVLKFKTKRLLRSL